MRESLDVLKSNLKFSRFFVNVATGHGDALKFLIGGYAPN